MGTRRQGSRASDAAGARVDHRELFAGSVVPSKIPLPVAGLINFLAPRSRADLLAIFDNKATAGAVRKWFARKRLPDWAAAALSAKVNAKMRLELERNLAELNRYVGPGQGWNKNATRGLGEWRARKNLARD